MFPNEYSSLVSIALSLSHILSALQKRRSELLSVLILCLIISLQVKTWNRQFDLNQVEL